MNFIETELKGAFIIELQRHEDDRGFFARSWCAREFGKHGLNERLVQCNISFNHERGTVRGLHFQLSPHEEAKLVRCTRGAIHDVIVDLRPGSPTYLEHLGVELTQENRTMLYVPEHFAHGFQTLHDNTEIFYQMAEYYAADAEAGFRWNDPAFQITWPLDISVISPRDSEYPDFIPAE